MPAPSTTTIWTALNPPIYLISILPGVGVWQLTHPAGPALFSLVAATVAVVLLQHAINLLNDVSDWRLGADQNKWESWVRYHKDDTRITALHGWLSFIAGGLLGLGILFYTGRSWILIIALPMVGLGYLYNSGERPLSYTRLGEWVTGLCYGPGVVGCLWLLIGEPISPAAVLAMVAFAALAVALLLSHQPPQIDTDRAAGKHSFAVRFGEDLTFRSARLLFGIFVLTWGIALLSSGISAPGIALVCGAAVWVISAVARAGLGPKRILISATALIAVVFVAQLIPGQDTLRFVRSHKLASASASPLQGDTNNRCYDVDISTRMRFLTKRGENSLHIVYNMQ